MRCYIFPQYLNILYSLQSLVRNSAVRLPADFVKFDTNVDKVITRREFVSRVRGNAFVARHMFVEADTNGRCTAFDITPIASLGQSIVIYLYIDLSDKQLSIVGGETARDEVVSRAWREGRNMCNSVLLSTISF